MLAFACYSIYNVYVIVKFDSFQNSTLEKQVLWYASQTKAAWLQQNPTIRLFRSHALSEK